MALNYYAGKSKSWLEAELAKAQADLSAGKTVTTASSEESAMGNLVQSSPQERIQMLLRALNRLDPTTYPWNDSIVASRTRAVFA